MIQVRYKVSNDIELKLSRIMASRKDRSRDRDTYGNIEKEGNLRVWTINAPIMTDECFLELHTGQRINKRYRVVGFDQSEPGGIFLSQHLSLRVLQEDEIYYEVF